MFPLARDELFAQVLFRAARFRHGLSEVGVRRVSVVGRRGGAQASFTIKELRELSRLDANLRIHAGELALGATVASQEEVASARPRQRLYSLLEAHAHADIASEAHAPPPEAPPVVI